MPTNLLRIDKMGDVTVLVLYGQKLIDPSVIEKLRVELCRLVEEKNETKLVLDFSNVEFLTSAMLNTLISLYAKLARRSGTLILCGIRPDILAAFQICKLDQVFEIMVDKTAALEKLSRGA